MRLIVKDMDIATGGIQIVLLNAKDARKLDLHHGDRVLVTKGDKKTVAILDIGESNKATPPGHVGVFEEVLKPLHAKQGDIIRIQLTDKPLSINFIKKKLDGIELNKSEIDQIVEDIVSNRLTEIELSFFISACYTNKLSMQETTYLAKAIVNSGERLGLRNGIIVDKHCSGGVPGNRTTMVVVPICVAAGLKMPKTSSRSISSPAGTADTMEVLAPVAVPIKRLRHIVRNIGGFIAWGGGVNLATADDKLIRVRHPLSLDPEGMLLASILAKKSAVGATHVLIDIPVGPQTKIKSEKQASHLKGEFEKLGHALGMKVHVILTDGREPIGHGIGPNLEARDVLWLLKNDPRAPMDLRKKSLFMAAEIMKMAGMKRPEETARVMLDSGLAFKKMQAIIREQGGDCHINPERIKVGVFSEKIVASKAGVIKSINSNGISRIARIAGAPLDKAAGIYLYYHVGERVSKGQTLFVVYSDSEEKLQYAMNEVKKNPPIEIR
ncbi:MAG: thymidine phosphorylase family protein [Candidatus Woesearchaeota archaeon]